MARQRSRRRTIPEFKPDSRRFSLLKRLYMTNLQRLQILRWSLYAVVCIFLLVVQDVIMSRITLFGGGTDLCVSAILLICVLEGTESGSIFVLIASMLYFFSGSAPGAYSIAMISFLGIGATMFRQLCWHRNFSSTVLCAGIAVMIYEMAVFIVGLMMRLTLFSRIGVFAMTGLLSWAVMLPLYPLVYTIGKIGGNTWKE